jgi:hypothetical protein
MPDLIGHRIINSFAAFNYAIPVFTGMTPGVFTVC